MNVKTLCLAILNFEDATGYEIKKNSSEGAFSHFVDVSFGSIYPTLAKLEQENLVTCRIQTQAGKPDKKIYSITTAGRAEFVRSLSIVPQRDVFKSEFLLLAMHANLAPHETLKEAFCDQIESVNAELLMMEHIIEECEEPSVLWAANYGKVVMDARKKYLEENKETLISLAGTPISQKAAE